MVKNLPLHHQIKYLQLYFFAFVISVVVFGPWLKNSFIGDDWPALLRNINVTWSEIPGWFVIMRAGWYRPLHDVFTAICWQAFGLDWQGYRIVTSILYASVATQAGIIAIQLTANNAAGWLSILFFCTFAVHAEPVLLFAATNELLAALFVLWGLGAYIRFRKINRWSWFVISIICCLAAFATKETGVVTPLFLILYDLINFAKREQFSRMLRLLPTFLILLTLGIYLSLRISAGSGYLTVVNPSLVRIILNFVYYLLVTLFAIPNNYAFVASLSRWQNSPQLPLLLLICSMTSLATLLIMLVRQRLWRWAWLDLRPLLFSILCFVFALAPVLLIVSTRAAFMATIALSWMLSIFVTDLWIRTNGEFRSRVAVIVATVLFLSAQTMGLIYQNRLWGRSSTLSTNVISQVETMVQTHPEVSSILLLNLPDHTEFATTFRNTFPAAGTVKGISTEIQVVLDSELSGLSDLERAQLIQTRIGKSEPLLLWFQDGALTLY